MGLKSRFTEGAPAPGQIAEEAARRAQMRAELQRFEYKVETVRSKLMGDKMDGGEIERLLDERAGEGWQLKSVTETDVKGRVGPGGTTGLLLIFEREV